MSNTVTLRSDFNVEFTDVGGVSFHIWNSVDFKGGQWDVVELTHLEAITLANILADGRVVADA